MRVYSYVVRLDHGFAPNPFHGVCTLATCKPKIRKFAVEGDWVMGTGSAKWNLAGRLIFAMRIGEITTFDRYWRDPRFRVKRPNLRGSLKLRFGDNIYHRTSPSAPWIQEDSRHSKDGAVVNLVNLKRDTGTTDRVLIADQFVYLGNRSQPVPSRFASLIMRTPGYTYSDDPAEVAALVQWFTKLDMGKIGDPVEWKSFRTWR